MRLNLLFWVLAICALMVAPMLAASQVFDMNLDHVGGMMRPVSGRPAFALATIRESKPGAEQRFNGIGMRPNRLEVTGTTLSDMIAFAYAVPDEKQLVGGPKWARTQRFDVTAQPEEAEVNALQKLAPSKLHDAMRVRLQVLLEQRFGLTVSFSRKDLPLLVLLQAKGGLKCRRVSETTAAAFDSLPPPPPPPEQHLAGHVESMHWAVPAFPFPMIVWWISQQPELGGRTVVDQTGLDGGFGCELSWSRDETDPTESSFFTALREQMGLRLQPQRGPVDVLVVQHVEQPSAN